MDKRPIRRKFRDNPYLLESIKEKNIYIIKFNDINGKHEVVVDKDIFDLFDKNEKYENARYFEYSKHLFHNEINYSQIKSNYSLEDEVINNLSLKELKYTIEMLPDIQKRRIKKYYFEEKTLEEIAMEEGCSKVAIKYSIDSALRKISKIFKIWLNFFTISLLKGESVKNFSPYFLGFVLWKFSVIYQIRSYYFEHINKYACE